MCMKKMIVFVQILLLIGGDWKHEHKRLDYLMFDIIYEYDKELVSNYYKEDEEITDEDGSDTYSSIHKYRIVLD